jgi:type IV secretory pathway TraG/TraD family ATPase VirD4
MEGRGILIANLDKGRLGEGPSALLGSMLLAQIALEALARSEKPIGERKDFWVYADEFQTFTTLSIATMLSELRKFAVGLTLSNQHLSQLDPAIRDAVFRERRNATLLPGRGQ